MFENFTPFNIQTQTSPPVTIHGITSPPSTPSKPPLVLLHGFPQTHHIFHLVAPHLLSKYTLILLDLRGYGASSKPSGVEHYAKSAMARDVATVMEELGYPTYYVCAHDRGARVTHKLLVDFPSRVKRAMLLDICPTAAMFKATNQEFATAYWHWFFLIQKSPLPEMLITSHARHFAELFMGGRLEDGVESFNKEAFEIYVKGLEDEESVHAMCEDYRAAATLDLDEARDDVEKGSQVRCDLRILWGSRGIIEKCFSGVEEWSRVCADGVRVTGRAVDCGHYIPEEKPEELVKEILEFFE